MATDLLNLPNCGGTTGTFNSGFAFCDVIRKAPKALLLVDAGVEFNAAARATIATMVAKIKEYTRAARGGRVYPIMSLSNFDDKSKEATKAAIGNLSIQEITMQEGIPSFTFEHFKGELFHKQLSAAQNANLKLMIIDSAYVLYGTVTSGGNLTAFSLAEFYAQLAKFANATTPAKYPFDVTLNDISEYKENLGIIQLDSTVLNISGNRDTVLTLIAQVTNVGKVQAVGNGGKNLGSLWATELAVTGAWTAKNQTSGATITVTGVAWDSTLGTFNVTVDNTAYTALGSGTKVLINLAAPAALTALGVDGIESTGGVEITKP